MAEDNAENPTNQTNELPDWAREQISNANAEAAKYRTEKKEAVEAAKAEVAESFQSKIKDLESKIEAEAAQGTSARHEVDRLKVTIEAGINAEKALSFADLLKGENEDELRSHAEELKKLFNDTDSGDQKRTSAVDPSQGAAGNHLPLNGDPLLKAITSIVNR